MEKSVIDLPLAGQSTTIKGNGVSQGNRCPFLGISENPGHAKSSPSELNFCHQPGLPVPIGSIHQEYYCLTSQYEKCPVYKEVDKRAVAAPSGSILETPAPKPISNITADNGSIFIPVGTTPPAAFSDVPVADIFDWAAKEEPGFTVFDPNVHVKIVRRRPRRRSGRGFLVLALIIMGVFLIAWGAWLSFISAEDSGDQSINNRLSRIPTLVPTANPALFGFGSEGTSGDNSIPQIIAAPTESLPEALVEEDGPEESLNFDAIALTASALFLGATPVDCSPPSWWVRYIVQSGDTVEALALARGITAEEIIRANCLTSDSLASVALIYLPPLGVIVTSTPGPLPTTAINIQITPRPPQATAQPLLFPTSPPVVIPPVVTSVVIPPVVTEPPVIIISTEAPPVVAPTSPPPPPPPQPQPTNPPQPTAPPAATPTSGPPPTATPPPLP